MRLNAPLVIGLAVLWSCLALVLSQTLSSQTGWLPHRMVASWDAPWLAKYLGRAAHEGPTAYGAKRIDRPQTEESVGVQAQRWSTVGEAWQQGQFEGTVALEGGRGLSLAMGKVEGIYVSSPWQAPFGISAVGAECQGAPLQGAEVVIEVRFSVDGQAWSPWQVLPTAHGETDFTEAWITELLGVSWEGGSAVDYVQYRLRLQRAPSGAAPVVRALTLTLLNSTRGPHMKAAKAALLPPVGDGGMPRPPIISRAGWGADESLMKWEPEYRQPVKVIIHHTVTYIPDSLATIRAIYYYHAVTRDWGDIGYNYLIDEQGNIYEGREGGEGVVAGHARGCNEGSIGIGLMGDFSSRPMSPSMESALIEMLAWIADRYGIAPQGRAPAWGLELPNIIGHRDVASTSCPGEQVYRRLPYLRAMAAQRLLVYPPSMTMRSPMSDSAVRGITRVEISSSSPLLAGIEFYIDGELTYTSRESPLIWEWDTTEWQDGGHILKAVARGYHELNGESVRTVVVDNSAPYGAIVINNGATYTHDREVNLTMAVADVGSGVQDMALTEDGEWQAREAFHARRDWLLSPGDGKKRIAVRFWDRAGNLSAVYSDTIILDDVPPLWEHPCIVRSDAVLMKVRDELSGLVTSSAEYALSDDGEQWGAWRSSSCSGSDGSTELQTVTASLSALLGGAIRFRVMDRAGNWSVSPMCILR